MFRPTFFKYAKKQKITSLVSSHKPTGFITHLFSFSENRIAIATNHSFEIWSEDMKDCLYKFEIQRRTGNERYLNEIRGIGLHSDGRLLLGTRTEILAFDPQTFQFESLMTLWGGEPKFIFAHQKHKFGYIACSWFPTPEYTLAFPSHAHSSQPLYFKRNEVWEQPPVALLKDGRLALAASYKEEDKNKSEQLIQLIKINEDQLKKPLTVDAGDNISQLIVLKNGDLVSCHYNAMKVWNCSSEQPKLIKTLSMPGRAMLYVELPDGRLITNGLAGRSWTDGSKYEKPRDRLLLWDLNQEKHLAEIILDDTLTGLSLTSNFKLLCAFGWKMDIYDISPWLDPAYKAKLQSELDNVIPVVDLQNLALEYLGF